MLLKPSVLTSKKDSNLRKYQEKSSMLLKSLQDFNKQGTRIPCLLKPKVLKAQDTSLLKSCKDFKSILLFKILQQQDFKSIKYRVRLGSLLEMFLCTKMWKEYLTVKNWPIVSNVQHSFVLNRMKILIWTLTYLIIAAINSRRGKGLTV